jgi:serine/threonine-protein kinase RsbW
MSRKREIRFTISSKISNVKPIRLRIKHLCEQENIDEMDIYNIQLALDEACSNAIEHGCLNNPKKEIEVHFKLNDDIMELIVSDTGGIEFNPEFFERIAIKKEWGAGGRGIYLINSLLDEVSFIFYPKHKTIIYMKKKIKRNG